MIKVRENTFLIFLLLLFFVALFLISKIYTAPQVPELEAKMVYIPKNMAFGATIDAASCNLEGGKPCSIDLDSAKKEIDAAASMGANFARFDAVGEALEDKYALQKLGEAVSYARSRKLKISLALWGRKEWAHSSGGKIGWNDFQKKYSQDAGSYAQRYRPDYFVLLPECPYAPGSQTDGEKTVEEWMAFAKQAALSAKQNSYGLKIILEGSMSADGDIGTGESEFLNAVIRNGDPVINIISIEAKNTNNLESGVKNLVRMKEKYHWQGNLWIGNINFFSGSSDDDGQEQKKLFLYAFYLAGDKGFSGISIGNLRDGIGSNNGILKQDYSAKPAYDAMKQVMAANK